MNESSSSQEAPLHFSRTGALNLAQFVHDRLGGRPGIYAMFFHQKNDHLMPEHDDQDLGVANFFRQIHLTCLPSPKKMRVNGWFGAVQVQKKSRAALLSVGLGHLISRSFFCQLRHAKSDYVQDTSSGFQYSIIYILYSLGIRKSICTCMRCSNIAMSGLLLAIFQVQFGALGCSPGEFPMFK